MPEPHLVLNALDAGEAEQALRGACGAERWVKRMLELRPFRSTAELLDSAEREWRQLSREDYLEAFAQHPQIGEDLDALRARFNGPLTTARREQAGVLNAAEGVLLALREGNRAYRERFGFIFIICASGRTAAEMLVALERRLKADPAAELAAAALEQAKITRLRLSGLSS